MLALIIANSPYLLPETPGAGQPRLKLPAYDVLIAADGGARHCLALGLYPSYVIGDLDSLEESHLAQLRDHGAQIVQYPRRKDHTDLELALEFTHQLGASKINILAALGARWDQTLANLLLPVRLPGVSIHLLEGPQEITYLRGGERIELTGLPGDTVSLIPLGGDASGITTHNLEYPLDHETLFFGTTRGISNLLLASPAYVSLDQGLLLCTLIHARQADNLSA
ncbi:MAG: thiamine diphosphokinase [Chloroflexota bacterium]